MKDFANSNSFSGSNPNISDPIESLYIHVPFCTRKCGYCDYYSINSELANFDQYLSGIELELKAILVEIAKNDLQLNKLKTLYIGGGTPSALPPDVMTSIIDLIKREIGFTDVLEFTIEVNPEPVGHQTVLAAIENGANRISLGYQAKQDHLLETIGRLHTNIDFLETLRLIRVYGINNISCDLMFGLPDQRLNDVLQSAKQLIELDIPHISFYSLILEPGTLFYHKYNKRPDLLPAEEVERAMYHSLLKFFNKTVMIIMNYQAVVNQAFILNIITIIGQPNHIWLWDRLLTVTIMGPGKAMPAQLINGWQIPKKMPSMKKLIFFKLCKNM